MFNNMKNLSSLTINKRHDRPAPRDRFDHKKLNQLYNDILRPLTLFPDPVQSADTAKTLVPVKDDTKEEVNEYICRDDIYMCALSPFMEDVSKMSACAVCDLVKRRLHKISALNGGSAEVQKAFEEIIINEVKLIYETIPLVLTSTVLTAQEKQNLHRRLITHILIVSEQLFIHYLQKMDRDKVQAVFSEEDNLTRLKAQLLLDCSKFINLFSAKHYLIKEIKELEGKETAQSKTDEPNRTSPEQTHQNATSGSGSHFTMVYFVRLGRPKLPTTKLQKDVDLMQIGNIQPLDLKKVRSLIPRKIDVKTVPENIKCEAVTTPCPLINLDDHKAEKSTKHLPMTKCTSCPNLRSSEILADEFCIRMKTYSSECPDTLTHVSTLKPEGDERSQDLKSLVGDPSLPRSAIGVDPRFDEEIPPLICALPHGVADKAKRYKMEALLQLLEQKQEQCKQNLETKPDLPPQTYTVDVLLPKKPLLRRADGQTSDRIYTHITEIPTYPTVYNHFSNEIEGASVARMDRNLFVGEELKEVYSELTKNISIDHLRFDQDAVIEPCASKLDFSKCAASSTLTRKKSQRVINKQLDSLASSDKFNSADQCLSIDKEASRVCNSWLAWWKSLVNFDDYMKYISTKDLDYLKVIYHLYNSDSEDEELAKLALKEEEEERKRERDKKIADLRAEKQNYTPGMWNINSVMLGGLGIYPGLQDMEAEHSKIERENVRSSSKGKSTMSQDPLQRKMNRIWKDLHVPEVLRLDMVIKYSSAEYHDHLPQAMEMWEKAVNFIRKREQILAGLEKFERAASDPNRFFQRGYEGTSMARMEESRIRKSFHSQVTETEREILDVLQELKKRFNDIVTFKGRPYVEKMQRDKTEMLYWLQQDRRIEVLERNVEKQHALEALTTAD